MGKADVNKVKSDAAIETVKQYLTERGYHFRDVSIHKDGENHGFDILAERESTLLKIEVKGSSKENGIPDCFWNEFDHKGRKHFMIADYMYVVRLNRASNPRQIEVLSKQEVDAYASEHSVQRRIRIASRLKTDLKNRRIGKVVSLRATAKENPMNPQSSNSENS